MRFKAVALLFVASLLTFGTGVTAHLLPAPAQTVIADGPAPPPEPLPWPPKAV